MKRIMAILLTIIMLATVFTACGNVGGISDYPSELEEAGISQEEYAAMSDEQKQALLDELGVVAPIGKEEKPQETPKAEKHTLDDVSKGGNYVVTVSDSMRWNYFELHYENGKLVKIVVSFQKNDEEEPEIEIIEGDAVADYGLYFIDYTQDAATVVNELINQGFTNIFIEKAN